MTTETELALPDEGGRYDCPLCDSRFESVGEKKRHIRTSHPKEKR
jgi:hypothetical protein